MNDFSYDEIPVGQKAEFSRVITDEMMNCFRMLSGDENPLHKDVQFAREHKFGGGGSVWHVRRQPVFYISRNISTGKVLFVAMRVC